MQLCVNLQYMSAGVPLCMLFSRHYFLDCILLGRHAGGRLRWQPVRHQFGRRIGDSKLNCHKDINRDRMWPPVATANWLGKYKASQSNTGSSNGNGRLDRS